MTGETYTLVGRALISKPSQVSRYALAKNQYTNERFKFSAFSAMSFNKEPPKSCPAKDAERLVGHDVCSSYERSNEVSARSDMDIDLTCPVLPRVFIP